MRQRFEQQNTLGITAIPDVKFPLRSRDELPPVLKSLQYIFTTPELNEKVFSLLEEIVCKDKKRTGRKGMDLWHILVLAVVRHTLSTNWDRMEDMAANHKLIRQVMGIHVEVFNIEEIIYPYQTIVDNVSLIDGIVLEKINLLVVEHGHNLLKKKEEEPLRLKTDSYVLETNVHFPTDLNLLWDSVRKCLDITEKIVKQTGLDGWRKIKLHRRNIKNSYRNASQQVFRSGKKDQKTIKQSVVDYLKLAEKLDERFNEVLSNVMFANPMTFVLLMELRHYQGYLKKHIDLVDRRILKGETIPADEKIYSIFEIHTEWIQKGKSRPSVELGHNLLITTDQYQFIVDYKVMEKQRDPSQVEPLIGRIQNNFPNRIISSHSFDKGFFSKENYAKLKESGIENVILPKKGKQNKEEKQRESEKQFKELRHAHSAIESNINMLEHHGLNRCPDKGLSNYKRYVGLSVLAYNLHIMGNHLIALERKKEEEKQKQRERYYRQAA